MGSAEALGGFFYYAFRNAFRIQCNLIVPETDDAPAFGFQKRRSCAVIRYLLKMLAAIELDRQFRLPTGEIDNVTTNYQLPGKGRSIARQGLPEFAFGRCGVPAQLSCSFRHLDFNAAHAEMIERRATLANPPLTPPFQGGEHG